VKGRLPSSLHSCTTGWEFLVLVLWSILVQLWLGFWEHFSQGFGGGLVQVLEHFSQGFGADLASTLRAPWSGLLEGCWADFWETSGQAFERLFGEI
jgi:hypothetical protein